MGFDDPEEIAELVKRAAAGEPEAWNSLVTRFNGLVWAIIRQHRLSREDAEDVAQVAWLRLLEGLGSLREPSRVGAWLATTTRHECLRVIRLRRRMTWEVVDPEPQPDPGPSPADVVTARDHMRAVFAIVRTLGPRCQQLLTLSAYKLPYREIAKLMGMPVGSIGPIRLRCLNQLRALLREAGINRDFPDS